MISSDRGTTREKPLKLPPVDKTQMLRRFDRTLVGRALLREVRDHKLGALIKFLPTIWKCESWVQGFEMGDGRVHFRFQNEKDLQAVMTNRPYHYDGSMIALQRWIPTVRRDFPTTIPFWVVIKGLPNYWCEEESVQSIGEDLGEFDVVDVSEPIPKVRVTLDSNLPLIVRREIDDAGQICVLDLHYEKLQKHCTRYLRLTHEAPQCPERPRDSQLGRKHHREPPRKREEDDFQGKKRPTREERGNGVSRGPRGPPEAAALSRPKSVRRDLMAELDTCQSKVTAPTKDSLTTKEWVRTTFPQEGRSGD
ncbi:hypothetical protein AALP_AA6G299500 [Arabis alpina]|uniref:DUF4283 domain-containing protein n=1 Tax=Arabis alpina TaxID=50452 RepID=A0A087GSM9_ARAAL|nr:hypothetical protein AALP_AA6G299500 [Arabis alpina]